ncbi:IgGFc-binding protein [Candidatus Kapabacteria bacterium]|nr:IgGFc-binding protein [Candidatus Kapabacteria bacterium]
MRKLILIILMIFVSIEAQENQVFSSQEGRYFMVGFLKNEIAQSNNAALYQQIFIGARKSTNITIIHPDNTEERKFIPAFSSVSINVSRSYEHRNFETVMNNMLYRIVADNPVTVYAYSTRSLSSDMYTVYPVHTWGKQYYVSTMGNDHYLEDDLTENWNVSRTGEVLIMSSQDNNQIEIDLSADTRSGLKGEKVNVTLNNGESYLLGSSEIMQNRGDNDLTGTSIKSSKPLGIVTGHMRTSVPQNLSGAANSKDHIVEMLTPANSFGKNFVSVPLNYAGDNHFKILATNNNTSVTITTSDGEIDLIELNELESTSVYYNLPAVWKSNEPVQIMHSMARIPEKICEVFFDPALMLLNPLDLFINSTFFQTPEYTIDENYNGFSANRCGDFYQSDQQYELHQITILMEEAAAYDIELDFMRLRSDVIELAIVAEIESENKKYYLANIPVQPGAHFISSQAGKFTCLNYGIGIYDSYAHNVGISIRNQNQSDSIPPQLTVNENCGQFEVQITDNHEFDTGYFEMIIDKSKNFNIEFQEEFNFETNGANLVGSVPNLKNSAYFSATFVDYLNNTSTYSFSYTGINIDIDTKNDIGDYLPNEIISTTFSVTNNSNRVLELIDIITPNEITILNPILLSYQMKPKEELVFQIEVNSDNEIGENSKTISALFECDVQSTTQFYYDIKNPSLVISGYDFKDVYLGDEKIGDILIGNSGNELVNLERLDFDQSNIFVIDTTGLSEKSISPSEQISLSATFLPELRNDYSLDITIYGSSTFNNNLIELNDSDRLLGRGVAPLFESIEHDFGTNWLGEIKSEKFKFTNNGNIGGELNFINYTQLNSYSTSSENIIENINVDIEPGADFEFEVFFEPNSTGTFTIDALFDTNWDLHPEIYFHSKGIAITNEITPIQNCNNNDTLIADTEYINNFTIIQNTGDVPVTINDIKLSEISRLNLGNPFFYSLPDARFQLLNVSEYIGQELQVGESIEIDLLVTGLVQDVYKIYIETEYQNPNTGPNQEPTIVESSLICYTVFDQEIPELSAELNGNSLIKSCIEETYELVLNNTGNIDIEILNIEVISNNDLSFDNLNLPQIIKANTSDYFEFGLLINKQDEREIKLEIEAKPIGLDTTLNISISKLITLDEEIIDGPDPDFLFTIKDEGTIGFEFEFPYSVNENVDFSMKLQADSKLMHLIEDDFELFLYDNNTIVETIQMNGFQTENEIEFRPEQINIDITEHTLVKFELPFLFLLATYYETDLIFEVSSDECFLPLNRSFKLDLEGVCAYKLRPIVAADDGLDARVDIKSNRLILDFETPNQTYVNVLFTDIKGAVVSTFEKKFVNKGEHLLYYELNGLPNGNYFLTFQTKYLTKNRIITISN